MIWKGIQLEEQTNRWEQDFPTQKFQAPARVRTHDPSWLPGGRTTNWATVTKISILNIKWSNKVEIWQSLEKRYIDCDFGSFLFPPPPTTKFFLENK